jgi:hypothetical protein
MSENEEENLTSPVSGGNYNDYEDFEFNNNNNTNSNNDDNNSNNNNNGDNKSDDNDSEEENVSFNSYDNYAYDDSELGSKNGGEDLSRKVFLPKSKSEDTKYHQSYDSYLNPPSPARPAWKRDNEAKRCYLCGSEFGLLTRKVRPSFISSFSLYF